MMTPMDSIPMLMHMVLIRSTMAMVICVTMMSAMSLCVIMMNTLEMTTLIMTLMMNMIAMTMATTIKDAMPESQCCSKRVKIHAGSQWDSQPHDDDDDDYDND